jgi:YbbR domain-containing protein
VQRRFFSNLWPKLITLLAVSIFWIIITLKQGDIVTVTAPIKFHNLPEGLALVKSSPEEVEVQLKTFSGLTPSPKKLDIMADVNLAKISEGISQLAIKNDDFQLPLGVMVTGINPSAVKVTIEKKVRKTLRIKVKTIGKPPGRRYSGKMTVDPPEVDAVGPQHIMEQLDSVETEEVNLNGVRRGAVLGKHLLSPSPQVKLLHEDSVTVRIGE